MRLAPVWPGSAAAAEAMLRNGKQGQLAWPLQELAQEPQLAEQIAQPQVLARVPALLVSAQPPLIQQAAQLLQLLVFNTQLQDWDCPEGKAAFRSLATAALATQNALTRTLVANATCCLPADLLLPQPEPPRPDPPATPPPPPLPVSKYLAHALSCL